MIRRHRPPAKPSLALIRRGNAFLKPGATPKKPAQRACRVCGCTDDRACPGGCWWVEPDLCSACAIPQEAEE
jgi:hypothetical protein